jgi:hypothetical protein
MVRACALFRFFRRGFGGMAIAIAKPQADQPAGTDEIDDLASAIAQGLRRGDADNAYRSIKTCPDACLAHAIPG